MLADRALLKHGLKLAQQAAPRGAQSLNDIFQMSSSHLYLVTGLGCMGHTVTTPNESARS